MVLRYTEPMDETADERIDDVMETAALSHVETRCAELVETAVSITPATNPEHSLAIAGATANEAAAPYLFQKYRETKSANTLKRHRYDLRLFSDYLLAAGVVPHKRPFATEPEAWAGVTWGLIEGFVAWQIQEGFSIASTNARLSTVKSYAALAVKAGSIDRQEGTLIGAVKGYSRNEGLNLDEKREVTRVGNKKAEAVSINDEQALLLKSVGKNSPASLRNQLIMTLLLEHGLRASELVSLTADSFDFDEQTFTFWRKKTKEWTTHELTVGAYKTAVSYQSLMPAEGGIFLGSRKGGELTTGTLNRITLSRLVQRLGVGVGFYRVEIWFNQKGEPRERKIGTLSAHDCRHYCATDMARKGYTIKKLMDWFGWTSPAMAMRYVESAEIHVRDMG